MLIFVGAALGRWPGWSRGPGAPRGRRDEKRAVLTDEVVTADELRARAEAALAAGRHEEAVVDGFRALAVRQVERGPAGRHPGRHRPRGGGALAREYPRLRTACTRAPRLFDAVLYGDRPATREQAARVLALDDDLVVRR